MKLFSSRVHGVLDYLTVAALPTIPRVLGWDARVTRTLDAAALAALAYSLSTDYELGAARKLSMRGHLAADAAWGSALLAAAGPAAGENKAAKALMVGWGLFALFASQTTENYSGTELSRIAAGTGTEARPAV